MLYIPLIHISHFIILLLMTYLLFILFHGDYFRQKRNWNSFPICVEISCKAVQTICLVCQQCMELLMNVQRSALVQGAYVPKGMVRAPLNTNNLRALAF